MKLFSVFLLAALFPLSLALAESLEQTPSPEASTTDSGSAPDPTHPFATDIQPRAPGAIWFYTSSYFEDGRRIPDGTARERVTETRVIEGVTCYRIELSHDWRSFLQRLTGVKLDPDDNRVFWEYFNANGSYHFESFNDEAPESLDQFGLTLPYPVETGHQYIVDDWSYTVLDNDRAVSVPAGNFQCVVYEMISPEDEEDPDRIRERLFMSPGVGLVVAEGDIWIDGEWVLDYRDELVSFDLKTASSTEQTSPESE